MTNEKVLIRRCNHDGTWLAILGNGWRYDGSMIIDATSSVELDLKIAQARYDDRWVTMEGNHVLIGGNGLVKAGVGGRLTGRKFGMRFKDYENGKTAKNGKKLVRPYKAFKGKGGHTEPTGRKAGKKGNSESNKKQMHSQAVADALKAHSNFSSKHKEELKNIMMNNMTPEQARFYSNFLQVAARKNSYNENTSGYFTPFGNAVHMNIKNNKWEMRAKIQRDGAFNTKIHEEFHQMDYMLSGTPLGKYQSMNGHDMYAFTDKRTVTGARMLSAIEKDITTYINSAIDKANKKTGSRIKQIKSVNRISSDVKMAIMVALKEEFATTQSKANISMFTDALGMCTRGRVLPREYGAGFWGHVKSYCERQGKDGANSETWANFGAYKFASDTATRKAMEKLMPNTIKVCNEVLDEMVSNHSDFSGW